MVIEQALLDGASNILSLPYQTFDDLPEVLAAADLHLVTMGEAMVGLVHPSKVYNAMAAGRAILAVAPHLSPVAELVRTHDVGWVVEHGEAEKLASLIAKLADMPTQERASHLRELGERAASAVATTYSKQRLLKGFCDRLEVGVEPARSSHPFAHA
jgi:glycosyltransferase involved in cell wall biosynthesis